MGIVTESKESLLYAKYPGMRCTLSPIFIVEIGHLLNGLLLSSSLKSLQLTASKFKVVKLAQKENALFLIVVTELGIVTDVKLLQFVKA